MTPTDGDWDAEQALEEFRRDAARLGFGTEDVSHLTAELETSEEFVARMKRQDREHHVPRRRRLLLAGAFTLAASAAVVFGITRPGGTPAAAEAPPVLDFEFAAATQIAYAPGENPDQILRLLTKAALERPAEPQPDGRVQYKKSDNWYAEVDDNGTARIVPRVTETWLRPDGSLTTQEHLGRPLTSDGRGALPNLGRQVADETLDPGTFDADFASTLPTDPAQLTEALLDHGQCEARRAGDERSLCLYRQVVELGQTYVLSPALEAGIWKVLADETGFRTLGSVKDRAGRDAVAISLVASSEPSIRHLVLGSLETGEIVGFEDILIRPQADLDVKPPSVLSFTTQLESAFVKSAPR